ncbi:MAG: polymer-forming cytoskeletal family protein [Gammaproteobacteria bacterium]|nr:MAG: polymer-forming cytoskeletal family protein [Gammaproteobacteria bacterium]
MMRKSKNSKSSKVHTLIGEESEIKGDISFEGGLFVDGTIIGNVVAKPGTVSVLNLSEKGTIEGEVRVPHIILNGTVIGDVYASERIELAVKARVTGNVFYNLIEMAIGAEINGQLVHEAEAKNPVLPRPKQETSQTAKVRVQPRPEVISEVTSDNRASAAGGQNS